MKPEILGKYPCGDSVALYLARDGIVELALIPQRMEDRLDADKFQGREMLVHASFSGDVADPEYTAGLSTRYSQTAKELRLISHGEEKGEIVTVLADQRSHRAIHRLKPMPEYGCFEARTEIQNLSDHDEWLEGLSAFSLGCLSPFSGGARAAEMTLHRLRSFWSGEGRLVSQRAGDLGLEEAWAVHGRRVEAFGNACSLPTRGWMPVALAEDSVTGVTWGAQLYCPSAWQMEYSTLDGTLCMAGGGGDFNQAHWRKLMKPGEAFSSPRAVLACGFGGVDAVTDRLTSAQRRGWEKAPASETDLPIMFNEWCTTWGNPTMENLTRIADKLRGRGIRYMTIDAGWYKHPVYGWDKCMGDWAVNRDMFPEGIKAAADMIRSRGMIPGIWFEMESAGPYAKAWNMEDMLLKRDGHVLTSGTRRFWDMENPKVVEYLSERVIGLLKDNGFGYLKVDYNETYGVGCDGYESLGEGLRRKTLASQAFFRKIREEIPDIVIENCSSGGHRLEPSMMELASQASFSDAHESKDIPVIAANLHRAILPAQSQIWAVLHGSDSDDRLYYSLCATFLGRMCLSGDIDELTDAQWAIVEGAMAFYRKIAPIVDKGRSRRLTGEVRSYRNLSGVQAIWREAEDRALLVLHRFDESGTEIEIPAGWRVSGEFGGDISRIDGSRLTVDAGSFSAKAYLLERV